MTSAGKGDDCPSRFETAFATIVSPNTSIGKNEEKARKATHSRKPTWPEESAFSSIEYAECSGRFAAKSKNFHIGNFGVETMVELKR